MNGAGRLAFVVACLTWAACQPGSEPAAASEPDPAAAIQPMVDQALLADLLGEAARIEGDEVHADGLLLRLAFEPLLRQTGPVSVQMVQSQGYRLTGIADGSPIWQLGLREGDILTGVDGQAILGRENEVRSAWEARPAQVEISYLRRTEERVLRLRIASGSSWRGAGQTGSSGAQRAALRRAAREASTATQGPSLIADFAAGLRCVEDPAPERIGRCELRRSVFESLLGSPEQLARQARIVPVKSDAAIQGIKLYSIRASSIPSLLGLANGDTLTSVNGHPIGSPDAALEAYAELRSTQKFSVELERGGQPLTLEIDLVETLSGPPSTFGP